MLKFFVALQTRFMDLRDRQEGQAYVEYGVLLVLIAIVLIGTVGLLEDEITDAFTKIKNAVAGL